jgi:hypothetical protein
MLHQRSLGKPGMRACEMERGASSSWDVDGTHVCVRMCMRETEARCYHTSLALQSHVVCQCRHAYMALNWIDGTTESSYPGLPKQCDVMLV